MKKPSDEKKSWWFLLGKSWSSSANRQWGAYIIDLLVSFVLFQVSAWATHSIDKAGATNVGSSMLALFLPMQIAYYPGAWWLFGRSLGMYLMSIRVVDLEMGPISFSQAITRYIAYCFLAVFFWFFALSMLLDGRNRGWHDKLARTFVIEDWQAN